MVQAIKNIPLTFFSRPFYINLLRRSTGIGMRFIFILVLIDLSYMAIASFSLFHEGINKLPEFAASLPVATFKDHKLSIDRPSPYILSWPKDAPKTPAKDKDKPLKFVIDTNYAIGDTAALERRMHDESIVTLFTADHMVTYMSQSHELRIQSYNSIPDTTITQERWVKWAKWGQAFFPLFFLLSLAFGAFLTNFVKVFLGALFAAFINLFTKSANGFGGAMRLSAAAAIPPALLFLFFPLLALPKLFIWLAYMMYGAFCARANTPRPT